MATYHGPTPVTPQDKVMAKNHLTSTKSLLIKKIADHQKAKAQTSVPASKSYNQSHLAAHQKDLQVVNSSLKTLGSKGLAMFLKRKKV